MSLTFCQQLCNTEGVSHSREQTIRKALLKNYYSLYRSGMRQTTRESTHYLKLLRKSFQFILELYQEFQDNATFPLFFQHIQIALIAAEKFKLDAFAIVCTLLHRVIQDNKLSASTLRKEFGDEIAEIIQGITKVYELTYQDLICQSNTPGFFTHFSPNNCLIILIKLAEYLQKMYHIEGYVWEMKNQLVDEAYRSYLPLTHNLGLDNIYLELTDLCLKAKHPTVYNVLTNKIKATKTSKAGFLERFATRIYTTIQSKGIRCAIKGRTKSIAAISNKIKNRGVTFEQINDLYAIRVIFESDLENEFNNCWYIYQVISDLYDVKVNKLRDWISRPKDDGNNYEALHLTVQSHEGPLVEVQIRTTRMNDKAEYGEAAHWRYKNNNLEQEFYAKNEHWLEQARAYLMPTNRPEIHKNIFIHVSKIYVDES